MTVLVHESVNSLITSNVTSFFDKKKKNKLTSMLNNYNLLLLLYNTDVFLIQGLCSVGREATWARMGVI